MAASPQIEPVLQSFLDGELGADDAEFVAAHLGHCGRCGIEASIHREVKGALRRLRPDLDVDAIDRLRDFADDLTRP